MDGWLIPNIFLCSCQSSGMWLRSFRIVSPSGSVPLRKPSEYQAQGWPCARCGPCRTDQGSALSIISEYRDVFPCPASYSRNAPASRLLSVTLRRCRLSDYSPTVPFAPDPDWNENSSVWGSVINMLLAKSRINMWTRMRNGRILSIQNGRKTVVYWQVRKIPAGCLVIGNRNHVFSMLCNF